MAVLPQSASTSQRSDSLSMNEIVRRLPSESRARLLADATRVAIRKDQVLRDDASDLSWAYLPYSRPVSLQVVADQYALAVHHLVGERRLGELFGLNAVFLRLVAGLIE